jgi:hypothetical protein
MAWRGWGARDGFSIPRQSQDAEYEQNVGDLFSVSKAQIVTGRAVFTDD